MSDESTPKPVSAASIELKDAIASAWVLLAGLLPGKLAPIAVGALAPFVGRGVAWLVQEHAQEWVAERYLAQMEKRAKRLPPNSPARLQLEQQVLELSKSIHEHRMSELIVVSTKTPPETK